MQSPHSSLPKLILLLKRQRNLRIGMGIALLITGFTLFLLLDSQKELSSYFAAIVSAIVALSGAYLVGHALMHFDVLQWDLVKVLKREPERVVWVYYYRSELMPYGIRMYQLCILYFCLEDRSKIAVRGTEASILKLMDALRSDLPSASFGHSADKEQWYLADPELLRK
jgi:hypothetical protein